MDLLDTSGRVFFFIIRVPISVGAVETKTTSCMGQCQGLRSYHDQIKNSAPPHLKWIQRCLDTYLVCPISVPQRRTPLATTHQCFLSELRLTR
jgi:hypothetical protein